jgi:hypothetical protein
MRGNPSFPAYAAVDDDIRPYVQCSGPPKALPPPVQPRPVLKRYRGQNSSLRIRRFAVANPKAVGKLNNTGGEPPEDMVVIDWLLFRDLESAGILVGYARAKEYSMIVGSGQLRYRIVAEWARLPDGWSFKEVGGVGVASIRDQSIATPLANRKLRCGRVRTLLGQCLLPMLSGEAEEN